MCVLKRSLSEDLSSYMLSLPGMKNAMALTWIFYFKLLYFSYTHISLISYINFNLRSCNYIMLLKNVLDSHFWNLNSYLLSTQSKVSSHNYHNTCQLDWSQQQTNINSLWIYRNHAELFFTLRTWINFNRFGELLAHLGLW